MTSFLYADVADPIREMLVTDVPPRDAPGESVSPYRNVTDERVTYAPPPLSWHALPSSRQSERIATESSVIDRPPPLSAARHPRISQCETNTVAADDT